GFLDAHPSSHEMSDGADLAIATSALSRFAQKVPSFRGAAEGCEPGTHIPEACVYGFRARRCAAPRNDGAFYGFCAKPCYPLPGSSYVRALSAARRRWASITVAWALDDG